MYEYDLICEISHFISTSSHKKICTKCRLYLSFGKIYVQSVLIFFKVLQASKHENKLVLAGLFFLLFGVFQVLKLAIKLENKLKNLNDFFYTFGVFQVLKLEIKPKNLNDLIVQSVLGSFSSAET